jgi:hypothetical protein
MEINMKATKYIRSVLKVCLTIAFLLVFGLAVENLYSPEIGTISEIAEDAKWPSITFCPMLYNVTSVPMLIGGQNYTFDDVFKLLPSMHSSFSVIIMLDAYNSKKQLLVLNDNLLII